MKPLVVKKSTEKPNPITTVSTTKSTTSTTPSTTTLKTMTSEKISTTTSTTTTVFSSSPRPDKTLEMSSTVTSHVLEKKSQAITEPLITPQAITAKPKFDMEKLDLALKITILTCLPLITISLCFIICKLNRKQNGMDTIDDIEESKIENSEMKVKTEDIYSTIEDETETKKPKCLESEIL